MSHGLRIKIAATVTALFLGGLIAAGLALRSDASQPAQPQQASASKVAEPAPAPAAPPAEDATMVPASTQSVETIDYDDELGEEEVGESEDEGDSE